jgi:hypothetical protein
MWAALTFDPMVAKSVAAEVIISGAAITYDMSVDLLASPGCHEPGGPPAVRTGWLNSLAALRRDIE